MSAHSECFEKCILIKFQPSLISPEFIQALRAFDRQALHARMLRLDHPITGEKMEWHAPLPIDMVAMIDILRKDTQENNEDDY